MLFVKELELFLLEIGNNPESDEQCENSDNPRTILLSIAREQLIEDILKPLASLLP
jgi:hypothetical protein